MEKSALEKLQEAKKDHEIALVCFFNNGKVRQDENYSAKRMERMNTKEDFDEIMEVFCNVTGRYAEECQFDNIQMGLELGLMFNQADIKDGSVKSNAQPIKDVVRYYTGSIKSFSNGQQTNKIDYGEFGRGRQGFISFKGLMDEVKKSGLQYIGPETFEEFEERILVGEPFDVILSANLNQKIEADEIQAKPQKKRFHR